MDFKASIRIMMIFQNSSALMCTLKPKHIPVVDHYRKLPENSLLKDRCVEGSFVEVSFGYHIIIHNSEPHTETVPGY